MKLISKKISCKKFLNDKKNLFKNSGMNFQKNKKKLIGFCFLMILGVGYCSKTGFSRNNRVNTGEFYGNYKGHRIGFFKKKKTLKIEN